MAVNVGEIVAMALIEAYGFGKPTLLRRISDMMSGVRIASAFRIHRWSFVCKQAL